MVSTVNSESEVRNSRIFGIISDWTTIWEGSSSLGLQKNGSGCDLAESNLKGRPWNCGKFRCHELEFRKGLPSEWGFGQPRGLVRSIQHVLQYTTGRKVFEQDCKMFSGYRGPLNGLPVTSSPTFAAGCIDLNPTDSCTIRMSVEHSLSRRSIAPC